MGGGAAVHVTSTSRERSPVSVANFARDSAAQPRWLPDRTPVAHGRAALPVRASALPGSVSSITAAGSASTGICSVTSSLTAKAFLAGALNSERPIFYADGGYADRILLQHRMRHGLKLVSVSVTGQVAL